MFERFADGAGSGVVAARQEAIRRPPLSSNRGFRATSYGNC
ncbi:hypothetical protein [Rhodococcus gordoniae]|nr:hypothetical protein [Rhodococcus gordoniae]